MKLLVPVLVLVLVLVNLVLFAWLRWGDASGPEAVLQPVTQTGERLVLMTDPGFAGPETPASAGSAARVAALDERLLAPRCMAWGPVDADVGRRLAARLKDDAIPMRLVEREAVVVVAYLVELRGFKDAGSARQAAERIRRAGIRDYALLTGIDGQSPGLSLGVFHQHDHALRRADRVRALGFEPDIRAVKSHDSQQYWQMRLPVPQSVLAAVRAAGVTDDPHRVACAERIEP
ncbi:MAG: hypothetical protein L0I62_08965 [Gammaproteobacteria bacterium]|nr:hypothetical protein [Gammaproteobacteria bacterium]